MWTWLIHGFVPLIAGSHDEPGIVRKFNQAENRFASSEWFSVRLDGSVWGHLRSFEVMLFKSFIKLQCTAFSEHILESWALSIFVRSSVPASSCGKSASQAFGTSWNILEPSDVSFFLASWPCKSMGSQVAIARWLRSCESTSGQWQKVCGHVRKLLGVHESYV